MPLSALAVARPVTTMMVFLAVVVLGWVSYMRLPVQLLPDIEFPTIVIIVANDRSAQENVDTITRDVEGLIAELPRVKRIRSRTEANRVLFRISLEYGVDLQYTAVDLEERLLAYRQSLNDPRLYINSFPFSTAEFQATFMLLSVRGQGDPAALFKTASERVEQQLRSINGVSNVEVRGLRADVIEVDLKPDLLSSYGLELGAVIGRVQAAASEDAFLGRLRLPSETWFVRLDDRIRTAEELANLYVDANGIVRLRDVADVYIGTSVDRWVSRSDGQNAIGIQMERESGRNLIDLARVTRERIAEINRSLPPGVELVIDEDFARYVEKAISDVRRLSIQGAMLALLVPLIFFGSARVALIVFLSVPISLIAVFNLFYAAGMSINIFSIIGLAMGVGMLVDNAIVVTENALRLWENGLSPKEAASRGGVEVGRGLLASTLTTGVVFIPIAFLDGEFKEIVREPTLALVFPLMLSLAVALTLIPVFVRGTLEAKARRPSKAPAMRSVRWRGAGWYGLFLKATLRNRARVIFVIVLAVAVTWLESCQRVQESSTSREANREWMEFYFRAPAGATLDEVNRAVVQVERRLSEHPDMRTFQVSFNSDGGQASVRFKERKDRVDGTPFRQLEQTMLDFIGEVPGLELSLRRFNDNLESAPVDLGNEGVVELKGIDPQTLEAWAGMLIEALRVHPAITNVRIREERSDPLYLVRLDRDKTQVYDVKAETLARYVGATRSRGTVSSLRLRDGDNITEVSFVIREAEGSTTDQVKDLTIFTANRGTVPLGELALFSKSRQQTQIRRTDRQSSLEVSYYFLPGSNITELAEDIKRLSRTLPNPAGVILEFQGETQRIDERRAQFMFTILSGAILVYVVMAAVFESFWVPFIILLTNPLMLIGIVWGLDIAGLPLDDLAAFGIILLVGLAVNNGIVMMDRTLELQRRGATRTRAVFEASLTRLRPILMTWMTTVLGLAPLALVGENDDQWRPVAVVIIGGLTSATVLTLVVLPCFYLIGDDFVRWARPWFLRGLKIGFETFEGIGNAVMHPWQTIRGRRPVAPSLRKLLWEVSSLLVSLMLAALRVLWSIPGDLREVIRPPAARELRSGSEKPIPSAPGQWPAPLLRVRNLQVHFPPRGFRALLRWLPVRLRRVLRIPNQGVHALHGVSLDLDRGLFGLLGPNGAGKTTLMRVIAGLQTTDRGSVRIAGQLQRDDPALLAPLIGYLPQDQGWYGWMTLREYLEFFALVWGRTIDRAIVLQGADGALAPLLASLAPLNTTEDRAAAIERVAREVNLSGDLDRRLDTFSGGMRQRAGIARLLLQAPPIIIVDEPTAKLDPVERVKVRLLLSRLARRRLVIFSTHLVEDLDHSCDHVGIMVRGRLAYIGSPEGLGATIGGALWEAQARHPAEIETLRQSAASARAVVVDQQVRGCVTILRAMGATRPEGWLHTPVEPTLEQALLSTLEAQHQGTLTR